MGNQIDNKQAETKPAGKVIVETKELTKRYDQTTVVDHLNLRINENEIFGLLGPNGAGKTTTMLMLLGLTEPSEGSARIFGHDTTREPLKVKRITGYLPEKVGFYENMTARQNLEFIAELNSISQADAKPLIQQTLETIGLTEKADLAVGKFSRGMKQRLGIGDVLIKRPKLAILDEPTAGLDPDGIIDIIDLISKLPQSGTAVVFSSHRLYEVQRVCDSIGIMSKGKMVIQGSIDQLSRQALSEGRYKIEVETAEPSPQLVPIISRLSGIRKVEAKGNTFEISADADLRSEIAKAIVQSNVPLTQMKIRDFSLDDVYMKYFHEGTEK